PPIPHAPSATAGAGARPFDRDRSRFASSWSFVLGAWCLVPGPFLVLGPSLVLSPQSPVPSPQLHVTDSHGERSCSGSLRSPPASSISPTSSEPGSSITEWKHW